MQSDNERLRLIWKERATLSQKEFGKKYELGSVSMVSQYLLGRRPLNLPAAVKFARGLGVPLEEISPTLAALAHKAAEASNVVPVSTTEAKFVPLLNYVQAGLWTSNGHCNYDEMLPVLFDDVDSMFALRLRGESMEPEFYEGDIVIIDSSIRPCPGDYVVARNAETFEATFKRYAVKGLDDNGNDVFELVPLNTLFPHLRSDQQPIEIVGVMVEHRRYRRRRDAIQRKW